MRVFVYDHCDLACLLGATGKFGMWNSPTKCTVEESVLNIGCQCSLLTSTIQRQRSWLRLMLGDGETRLLALKVLFFANTTQTLPGVWQRVLI